MLRFQLSDRVTDALRRGYAKSCGTTHILACLRTPHVPLAVWLRDLLRSSRRVIPIMNRTGELRFRVQESVQYLSPPPPTSPLWDNRASLTRPSCHWGGGSATVLLWRGAERLVVGTRNEPGSAHRTHCGTCAHKDCCCGTCCGWMKERLGKKERSGVGTAGERIGPRNEND